MRRSLGGVVVVALTLAVPAACAGGGGSSAKSANATTARPTSTTAPRVPVLFSPQGNNLDAYTTAPPFRHQRVITNHDTDPHGWDINGQICFLDADTFVAGEDTGQPHPPAGWAVFSLRGDNVGDLRATRVTRLVPTYQPTDKY